MVKSIISTTYSDTYLYFLPITVFCWNKLNVDVICFMPSGQSVIKKDNSLLVGVYPDGNKKSYLINKTIIENEGRFSTHYFSCPEHKEATAAQCVRLYGACLDLPEDEILVMGDVDLLPFKVPPYTNNGFNVFGSDLVPNEQLPMCYVSAPVRLWRDDFCKNRTYQQCLDDLVGVIECENFRGNQWSLDQSELYRCIANTNNLRNLIPRARPNTQFADNRVDREDINWRAYVNEDLVDAHLWRPGYTDENFANIMELLTMKYPNDDFTWLENYNHAYKQLL